MIKKDFDMLPVGTKIKLSKSMVMKLHLKYGEPFLQEIKMVYDGHPYCSLNDIGIRYGLTRERVRQIFKIMFNCGVRDIRKEKQDFKTCIHDPRRKVADYKDGSLQMIGAVAEKRFLSSCKDRGLNSNACKHRAIDIEVNGFLVDVKNCTTEYKPKGCLTPHYHYSFSRYQRENCDFLACFHQRENTFFIIPKYAFKKSNEIFINVYKTYNKNSKNSYWEFKDAWNLLEVPKDQVA